MDDFQFGRILAYLPDLLRGVGVTFQLGLISASVGLVFGLVLALMKFSRHPLAYWPAYVYIEFFRTTPPLVQIVWLYYGLPLITGRDLGAFGAAAVALGLNIAAFYSEIFRAGLAGVHRTQWQASRVLGLSVADTLRFVVLPQAIRNVLPPMGTTTIYLIKDTALASAIGTPELPSKRSDVSIRHAMTNRDFPYMSMVPETSIPGGQRHLVEKSRPLTHSTSALALAPVAHSPPLDKQIERRADQFPQKIR